MLALKGGDRISIAPNVALHGDAKNDFFLALNVVTGEQYLLNSTSFWVMESVTEGIDWAMLKESFFQKFEVDRTHADRDLTKLASQLLELGLVKIAGGEKQ